MTHGAGGTRGAYLPTQAPARGAAEQPTIRKEDAAMLWTLAVVFLVLWGLGFVAFHVTTGFIHLLLLAALVVVVLQLVSGRRAAI
jgi:hypothetical protein